MGEIMNINSVVKERTVLSERKDIGWGEDDKAAVVLRFDDRCGNGHNTFTITIDARNYGGCMHDEIREHFPEYAHLIKWHLVSTDGPMHYIANTVYHAKAGALDYARSCAVAPDATLSQLLDKEWLAARLQALMAEFEATMLSIDWEG